MTTNNPPPTPPTRTGLHGLMQQWRERAMRDDAELHPRTGERVRQCADELQTAVQDQEAEIERLAIAYHMTVEGEYGCPGATCPGVKRLVVFGRECAGFPKLRTER